MRPVLLPVSLCMCLLLAGCQVTGAHDLHDTTVAPGSNSITLPQGGSLGQTFVARHAGLDGVSLYVAQMTFDTEITLDVHILDSAMPGAQDIRTAQLRLDPSTHVGWQHVTFNPLTDSHNQTYYLVISGTLPAGSRVKLATAPANGYQDGALYINGRPVDGQLPLELNYAEGAILADLMVWLVGALGVCAAVAWLFLIPGLALQITLLPLPEENWKTRFGLATGLGLGLYAPLFVWAKAANIAPGAMVTVVVPCIGLAGLVWYLVRRRSWQRWPGEVTKWWHSTARQPDLVFIVLVGLLVLVRLALLRETDAPMWGDSVQHAMISQLIYEHGGLFDSWLPYAPYSTLTVHPGFHIITALFMWLTGQTVLQSMLLSGQVVNALGIVTLVPLAQRLIKSNWSGTGVVLVAGLLSPLPTGFLNWGRYPQLFGQSILPVAVWLVWRLIVDRDHAQAGVFIACGLSVASSFLAYYRTAQVIAVFAFMALIARAVLQSQLVLHRTTHDEYPEQVEYRKAAQSASSPIVGHAVQSGRPINPTQASSKLILLKLLLSACLALVIVSPWLLHLRGTALAEGMDASNTGMNNLPAIWSDYQVFFTQGPALLSGALIVLSVVIAMWSVLRGHWEIWVIGIWGVALIGLPALRLLPLPGINNEQAFAVLVGLYIPIGLLVGSAVDALLEWSSHAGLPLLWAGNAGVVLVAVLGIRGQLNVLNPNDRILAPADLRAFTWIRSNTPKSAYFLVDGFLVFDGRSAVGSDGGWWIPLLTQRRSTMPPQYPLLVERPVDRQYNQMVVDMVSKVRQQGVTSPDTIALLCRYGITHVYVGQEQGRIGTPPPQPMLSLANLERSPYYSTLYRQDKVGIFALHPSACNQN